MAKRKTRKVGGYSKKVPVTGPTIIRFVDLEEGLVFRFVGAEAIGFYGKGLFQKRGKRDFENWDGGFAQWANGTMLDPSAILVEIVKVKFADEPFHAAPAPGKGRR